MKRFVLLTTVASSLVLSLTTFCDAQSIRQAIAARISQPPVIDGRLTDPAWAAAKELDGFVLLNSLDKRPEAPTYVKALTDGEALFVGFRCVEPKMDRLKAETQDRDASVWQDDCVEVMIDPTNDRGRIYHLIANAVASRFDALCPVEGPEQTGEDKSWNGEWEVATSKGSGEWYAEFRIPFASVEISPDECPCVGINLARERFAGRHELTCWSPSRRVFINPACLGELVLASADGMHCTLEFPMPSTVFLGRQALEFKARNWSDAPARVKYIYRLTGTKEAWGDSDPVTIGPGRSKTMSLPINIADAGSYRLTLRLEEADSGRALYCLARQFEVPRVLEMKDSLYSLYHKRAEADVYANIPTSRAKGVELIISLLKEGTPAPIAEKKLIPPFASPIRASFDLAGQGSGTYKLRAEVRGGEQVLASMESRPMPYNPRPRIGFSPDGFLIVNNRPYFPVGIYTLQSKSGDHDAVLAEARQAGFNTTVYYASNLPDVIPLLDAAHRNGIKAFVYPTKPFTYRTGKETVAEIVKDIEARKDHPALLGWYLVDEPEGIGKAGFDMVRELYQTVKQVDTDHPCSLVIMSPKAAADYSGCTDVMWIDPYPVPGRPVTYVSDCTAGAVAAVETNKAVWVIPQAFDWAVWHAGKVENVHRPTPEEERCMTYLALVHGAKGIIYWAHTASRYYIRDYPEHWAAVKKIAGELRDLSPALLTPDSKRELSVAPEGATVDTMVKELDGRVYVFAVNREPEPCSASFRLPGISPAVRVEVLFENRAFQAAGGSWKDDFKPLDVHVYRVSGR